MKEEEMAKKVEVSYNPQLGYLETVFRHDFDFLTGVRSYEVRSCGVDFAVETYHRNRAVVTIDLVGANAVRFQMFPYGNTDCFRNEVFAGFLTLVNRIIWQKPHNCGFFMSSL